MYHIETSKTKAARNIYVALLSLAAAMIALILIGTIFALLRPSNAAPILTLGKDTPVRAGATSAKDSDIRVFSGIGRLRIPLSNSSTMILSISFPYQANDIAFTEELAAKISEFKNIATDYFSSLSEEKITYFDEDSAKIEILKRFNAGLRLGRIDAIYFNDLMIID